ncbi:PKD domain-containing protein [Euryarchaeota archaeon]|nr:PKD domain-containing protein [Euryarchaeota archaeon]
MTQKRNSRIALLAVAMLLSGALLGLMSEDSSAADYNAVGFISSTDSSGVSVTYINQESGNSATTTSEDDGSYSFDNLYDGEYSVRYSKAGYLSVLDNWTIPSDLPLTEVSMVAAPSGSTTVTVNVKDGDDTVIEDATVYLMSATTEDSWWNDISVGYTVSNATDDEGNTDFESLTADQYDIRVEASGYATAFGTTADTNIVMNALDDTNKQTVRVFDSSGNPLSNANVFMYDATSSTWYDSTKVGYTYYLQPTAGSEVYVYAYHAGSTPSVKRIASVSGTDTHNMNVNGNSAADDGTIYINAAPSNGGQSMEPLSGDRMIKLNPGPTASMSVTSETTEMDDKHVIAADGTVNFSASSSTSPVGGLTYSWGSETFSSSYAAGEHSVSVTVTDEFGAQDTASITIAADGDSPVAAFATTVKTNAGSEDITYDGMNLDEDINTAIFNGSTSSDSVGIASYSWDFGDESSDSGSIVNHIFDNPGTYDVVLTVTDIAGNSDTETLSVIVNDITSPSADFSWHYLNETGSEINGASIEGEKTFFNASRSSDNSGDDLVYAWDFGDGNEGNGMNINHTFNGTTEDGFNVVLTVTDSSNMSDVISYKIKPALKSRPDIYMVSMSFSDNLEEGNIITLDATVRCLCDDAKIDSAFEVAFYLDNLEGTVIGTAMIDGSDLEALNNGTNVNVTTTWTAVSGSQTIYVDADSTNIVDESQEKNELSKPITISAKDDSSDVTSMTMIIIVVLAAFGAVAYIYRDSLFSN